MRVTGTGTGTGSGLVVLVVLMSLALRLSGTASATAAPPPPPPLQVFIDFLQMHSLDKAIVYNCDSILEQARTVSALSRAGVSTRMVDVTTSTSTSLHQKLQMFFDFKQRTGVFVDVDCADVVDVINGGKQYDVQLGGMFSHMSWWAVFTRSAAGVGAGAGAGAGAGGALQALRSLPLTLNSQLLLIIRENASWYAYDVYTMDYRKPTPLNITFYAIHSDTAGEELVQEGVAQDDVTTYSSPLLLQRDGRYTALELQQRYDTLRAGAERVAWGWGWGRGRGRGWWGVPRETKVYRRRCLHQATLIGTYALNDKPRHMSERAYLASERDRHLDSPPRYCLLLLSYMQLMYHFNVRLIRAEQWAGKRNGTWVGIAGALQRGLADLGAAPMAVKKERLEAVEFSGFVASTVFPTVFRQPETAASSSLSVFTAPLSALAWGAALPLSLLAAGLLALTGILETRYVGSFDNYKFDLGSILLDFINIFYLDASWRESRLWCGRATSLIACTLGLLLMQFYSASLLATVLAPPPKLINSLDDLMRSDMHYKVEDVAYQHQFFNENMEKPEIKQLYTRVTQGDVPPFIDNDEGFKLVKKGNYAFQCTSTYAYHEISRWSDELICTVDELLIYPRLYFSLYFSVERGSPYTQHISTALVMMSERGVAARSRPRYYTPRPRCPPEHAAAPRPVAIVQFLPALRMLATLSLVSVGVLLVELITYRLENKRTNITL